MEPTPRKTKLYRTLCKDYSPKQADMQICKYIEGLEQRIADLEAKQSETKRRKPKSAEEENAAPAAAAQEQGDAQQAEQQEV